MDEQLLAPGNTKLLKMVRDKPLSFETLIVHDELPEEVYRCTKLRSLSLIRVAGFDKRIGALSGLEELRVRLSPIAEVPGEVSQLTKLRELTFDRCPAISALPKLAKLHTLRTLSLEGCTKMTALPSDVVTLPKLQEIFLPETVESLPNGFGALTKLTEILLSVSALGSIAGDLAKLTELTRMVVEGKAKVLPATLGGLVALESLVLRSLGLTALPESMGELLNLQTLDVDKNKLTELASIVAKLPKLRTVKLAGNPLSADESALIRKLVKAPPAKRAAMLGGAKEKGKAKSDGPEHLGTVTAMSAGLILVVADAKDAQSWDPEEHEPTFDLKKKGGNMTPVLEDQDAQAVACCMAIHRGVGEVFARSDEFHIVESYLDEEAAEGEHPEHVEFVSTPLDAKTCTRGIVRVHSKALALFAAEFAFSEDETEDAIASVLEGGGAEECELDAGGGVVIAVPNGLYEVLIEPVDKKEKAQRVVVRKTAK